MVRTKPGTLSPEKTEWTTAAAAAEAAANAD